MGGRAGQRLMNRLGMPTGRQTLIRQVTAAARRAICVKPIRVLGVDDWAWNKGKLFGTILVDLERGEVADLLPTRSADSLTAWLEQHPEVMVVSRDRQGSYADGARRGAPQAMQVADRFHLTLNLTQAVERELAVQRQYLQLAPSKALELQAPRELNRARSADRQISIQSSVRQQEVEMRRQRRQENMELFQTLHRMKAAGLKVTEMAKELGLNRRRLDRWLRLDALPERYRMQPRPGMPEAFREHLRERWEAGCRHGRTLFAEVRELGYVGCFSRLAALLSPWRQPSAEAATLLPQTPLMAETITVPGRRVSPQVAAALLGKIGSELTLRQREIVDRFKQHCPGYAVMRKLVLSFRTILRVGKLATLHGWMERALKTGIHALQRFVRTLKQDMGAVEAAVTERWSNGPVEGHVNRLKTIKRQMYGRAGVELLRARLLPETCSLEHQL
jgi:transposase